MEKDLKKLYTYARQRIRQKKKLYFHFVLFLFGCLLMFVTAVLLQTGISDYWFLGIACGWFFILLLHFSKVYIKDRFMNKAWEKEQIENLIRRQRNRIQQLETKVKPDSEYIKSE